MLMYEVIPVTHFMENCSLLWCSETKAAALVDPGGDSDKLISLIESKGLQLQQVILTHGHLDHVGAADQLRSHFSAAIVGPHYEDLFWLSMLPRQAQMFGFPDTQSFNPDRWLKEGDEVEIGNLKLQILHCPGHTPGHIVLWHPESRLAWVGDVLFAGSIGRTDFPRGDHATLLQSINEKLLPLGDDITFIPGHGPSSTFGRERVSNPYLALPIY